MTQVSAGFKGCDTTGITAWSLDANQFREKGARSRLTSRAADAILQKAKRLPSGNWSPGNYRLPKHEDRLDDGGRCPLYAFPRAMTNKSNIEIARKSGLPISRLDCCLPSLMQSTEHDHLLGISLSGRFENCFGVLQKRHLP